MPSTRQEQTLRVNNKGDTYPHREVVGQKVYIRQQPAALPPQPQVQVLTDQVFQAVNRPDKYSSYMIMMGYSMDTYTKDVMDGFVNLEFPYVIVFLGTMQIGVFEPIRFASEVDGLINAITEVNPNCHVVFSGLAPRPVDDVRSRDRLNRMTSVLAKQVEQARKQRGCNCGFVNIMDNLLDEAGAIKQPQVNFTEQLYLSTSGTRIIRAAWLRHLSSRKNYYNQYNTISGYACIVAIHVGLVAGL